MTILWPPSGSVMKLASDIIDIFAKQPGLPDDAFHLAYVVRVVTPGTFTLPEAVVEDMYRPSMMARTDSGQTIADPR